MNDSDALIFIIITFFAVTILSRIINFVLGTYYMEPGAECELWAFAISFIIDSIAMYGLVKFGYSEGIAEALNLVYIKAFFFILFYFLTVILIEFIFKETANFLNFIF